jgi:phosphoketolase
MGCNPHAFGGRLRRPLHRPPLAECAIEIRGKKRGEPEEGPINILAKYLAKVVVQNPSNFRIFSPDELMSNKLGGVDHVNLVIANKNPMPTWLSMDEAVAHCRAGAPHPSGQERAGDLRPYDSG